MDGSQFDCLYQDGDSFYIGNLKVDVMHTPGHTPACVTYMIGDTAFIGDTLFMPDFGTARADFPGGSAAKLYQSIQKILALPDSTRLFLCHDYKAPGRDSFCWETTVAEQKKLNIHVGRGVTETEFVSMRTSRDEALSMPHLLIPSIKITLLLSGSKLATAPFIQATPAGQTALISLQVSSFLKTPAPTIVHPGW